MDAQATDWETHLRLDGNAVAGVLQEIFATEMTVAPVRCANCGREGEVASLVAFTHGPGVVLRCPACENIVLRVVQTPQTIYMDARGAAFLSIPRPV